MKIEMQYETLLDLKKEINEKLKHSSFQTIKELILWLAKNQEFQKLKKKDNSLKSLDFFCDIWLEEMKRLPDLEINQNIFLTVYSLDELEEKYQKIKFLALRLENDLPKELCEDMLNNVLQEKVSGIAIGKIIVLETVKIEENILKIARVLKEKMQLVTAILLLEYVHKLYGENEQFLIEMAECWMAAQQFSKALECLKFIKNPNQSLIDVIQELEKITNHEKV